MKTVLYAHGGSKNHGCEAIVRSTVNMLKGVGDKPLLVTDQKTEDVLYGIDKICTLTESNKAINKASLSFAQAYFKLKLLKQPDAMDALLYSNGVKAAEKGDVALSIGGDNYCYKNLNHYIMLHNEYRKRGVKTVLWGCSVEPELLNDPRIAEDIAKYQLITAREPYSYEALKAVNPNTVKVADPAFTLNTEAVTLPENMVKGNTVGINLSPMIIYNEKSKGAAFENYKQLCRYILKETDMTIALIPHVVWQNNDDREPLRALYDEFASTGKVCLIDDCGCEKLKGYISACRFLVAARTHASIAAYSSCVPTLVVGYSVKANGIAKDLFGTENGYVLPVQELSEKLDLTNAFKTRLDNEKADAERLKSFMPQYKKLALKGAEELKKL